jgi:hypothetical protein
MIGRDARPGQEGGNAEPASCREIRLRLMGGDCTPMIFVGLAAIDASSTRIVIAQERHCPGSNHPDGKQRKRLVESATFTIRARPVATVAGAMVIDNLLGRW